MVFRFIYATTVGGIAGVKQAQSGVFPICNECKRQLLRPAQIVIDGGAGFWVAVLGRVDKADSHSAVIVIQGWKMGASFESKPHRRR
ncbi:MAG: hypothetical protein ACJAVR_003858, partial [Paracoccaceae bacterium]